MVALETPSVPPTSLITTTARPPGAASIASTSSVKGWEKSPIVRFTSRTLAPLPKHTLLLEGWGSAGPLPVFGAGTRMVPALGKVLVTVLNFVVAERNYVAGRPPPEASRPSTSIVSCRGTALPSASSAPASSAPERSSTELSTATRVSG